jgi:hypothetical protein
VSQADLVILQTVLAVLVTVAAVLLAIKPLDRLVDRLFRR